MTSDIQVLIADDHPIVCNALRMLLEPAEGISVVGEAHTGREALQMVEALHPNVLLLDVEMPDLSGVEVIQRLAKPDANITAHPTRILGLSSHDDSEFIFQLLSFGAAGYLLKDEVPENIIEAVRGVARGEIGWVSRKVAGRLGEIMRRDQQGDQSLTPRELSVLKLVAVAKTNGEIGAALGISEKTVEKHVDSIFRKLRVASRVEAAVLAVKEKLV